MPCLWTCCYVYTFIFIQGFTFIFQKFKEPEKSVRVEEIDGVKLVKNLAVKMEEMFRKKAEATRVRGAFWKSAFNSVLGE